MITYGSYIQKTDNLVSSAGGGSFSDTPVAVILILIFIKTIAG
jgi:SNF family Na+-dependent transporter